MGYFVKKQMMLKLHAACAFLLLLAAALSSVEAQEQGKMAQTQEQGKMAQPTVALHCPILSICSWILITGYLYLRHTCTKNKLCS